MKAKPVPTFQWSDIDDLRSQVKMADDTVPPRAFTVADYARQYKLEYKTAAVQLQKLAQRGKLTRGVQRVLVSDGRHHPVMHYWRVG
jgi:hypothetical protein